MASQFAPETADGWATVHQFFTVNWQGLLALSEGERNKILADSTEYFSVKEQYSETEGQSACFHILGHKAQFLALHFRPTFASCGQSEIDIARLPIAKYLTLADSYVSVVELGMYHITKKIVNRLAEQGLKPHSEEWTAAYREHHQSHKESLHPRAYTEIPERKYICFYPMDKRRGDQHNWYHESIDVRATYMMEHGMTGRRFAGKVNQVITGSIGFDDWEWGVTLFADDPLDIKRLVYEMRFDDATSLYGDFGRFLFGSRIPAHELGRYFNGALPQ